MPKVFADYCQVERNQDFVFEWSYRSPYLVYTLDFIWNTVHTGFEYRLHNVARFACFIPVKGDYCCRLNGRMLRVPPGSLLLVTPSQFHADVLDDDILFACIQFSLKDAITGEEVIHFFGAETPPERQVLRFTPPLLRRYELLRDEITAFRNTANPRPIYAQFLSFLECMEECYPSTDLANHRPPEKPIEHFTARMTALFEQNLETFLSLSDICRAMRMGRSALYQHSVQGFCEGPVRAFMRFKLSRARQMMRSSGLSLKEISEQLGFPNQMQFSRVYRKFYRESPSETLKRFTLK